MTVQLALRPARERSVTSRDAVKLQDEELSTTQIDQNISRNFNNLSKYFEENALALQNLRRQSLGRIVKSRVISDIGFNNLGTLGDSDHAFFRGGAPIVQYAPPKKGAVSIRKVVPRLIVMHSFGGYFDISFLNKNRSAKSRAVEPLTGHNPQRYWSGIRELTASKRRAAIHHLISRRGDLTNSAGWDLKAIASGGKESRAINFDVSLNSIGIELEEHIIRVGDERRIALRNFMLNRVPYTEEQYAVIAFIAKKYISWTNNTDILKWLGFQSAGLQAAKAGGTGFLNHRASQRSHADPSAEFLLEEDFVKGDPTPTYFEPHDAKLFPQRVELHWSDVPNGTNLSAWARIFDKVTRIRGFKVATELFDQSLDAGPVDVVTPTGVEGTHIAAAAGIANRDRIAQYDRAQQMTQQTRSTLYQREQVRKSSLNDAITDATSRTRAATKKQAVKVATVISAVGFDFVKGEWVTADTVNKFGKKLSG